VYQDVPHDLPDDVLAAWEAYDVAIADRADRLLDGYDFQTRAQTETALGVDEDQDAPPDAPDPDWWARLGQLDAPVWLQEGDSYRPDDAPDGSVLVRADAPADDERPGLDPALRQAHQEAQARQQGARLDAQEAAASDVAEAIMRHHQEG
jgi:hypothetical protein